MLVSNLTATSALLNTSVFTYDEVRATRLVALSGIAYCCGTLGHGVRNWDCHACAGFAGVQASAFSSTGLYAQSGFVAYDPHDGPEGSLVVALTGTDPLKIAEWIDDIDTVSVQYPACAGCKVHQGFYENYKSVHADMRVLIDGFAAEHPRAPLWVTGHSLGAAVAYHAAVDLMQGAHARRLRGVYTYGQPRVGNSNFASWTAQLLGAVPVFRVTHRQDPVPHLPLEAMGFAHVPREVYYAGASKVGPAQGGAAISRQGGAAGAGRGWPRLGDIRHAMSMEYTMGRQLWW